MLGSPRRAGTKVIAVVALTAIIFTLAACNSVDPTDPTNFNSVAVRNDLGTNIVLVQCDTTCSTLHDRVPMKPGDTVTVSVSNENIEVGYVVISAATNRTLGCLYFRYSRSEQGLTENVSSLQRCH